MEKTFKVGDIRQLIQESSSEFKAKLGDKVESENKKNNDKALKDSENINKEHYGEKLEAPKIAKYEKIDGNKTTTDVRLDGDVSDKTKARIKAQAEGYTSEAEKNNGIEKSGDFEKNKEIFDGIKKTGEQMEKNREEFAHLGIQGHNMPKEMTHYANLYENKNIKTIYFKKTEFINEEHMISRIPDEFKCEGKMFRMKDKVDNEYLIEWQDNKANILEHKNIHGRDEAIEKMRYLFNYNSADTFKTSTAAERLNENQENFEARLNNLRNIQK